MKTELIPFHGEIITTIETPEGIYLPVKPLCERFGVSNQGQLSKFRAAPERWGIKIIFIPSASGEQETSCIPINRIAAWLFTLNVNKVKPEVRDALIRYQAEAADVLDRHFRLKHTEQDAAFQQQIVDYEDQLTYCHAHLLAALPKWSKMRGLLAIGQNWSYVAKRCSLSQMQYLDEHEAMMNCGLQDETHRGSKTGPKTSRQTIRDLEWALDEARRAAPENAAPSLDA